MALSIGILGLTHDHVWGNLADLKQSSLGELVAAADPNDEIAHFALGRALLESGDAAEAAKSFQRVLALNPNNKFPVLRDDESDLNRMYRENAERILLQSVAAATMSACTMPRPVGSCASKAAASSIITAHRSSLVGRYR